LRRLLQNQLTKQWHPIKIAPLLIPAQNETQLQPCQTMLDSAAIGRYTILVQQRHQCGKVERRFVDGCVDHRESNVEDCLRCYYKASKYDHKRFFSCTTGQGLALPSLGADRKFSGIFAPVSTEAHRQSPHRLDAASHLCTAACACQSARWLCRASTAMADAARTTLPAFVPALTSLKYGLEYCRSFLHHGQPARHTAPVRYGRLSATRWHASRTLEAGAGLLRRRVAPEVGMHYTTSPSGQSSRNRRRLRALRSLLGTPEALSPPLS
jgi:hypothetical protein